MKDLLKLLSLIDNQSIGGSKMDCVKLDIYSMNVLNKIFETNGVTPGNYYFVSSSGNFVALYRYSANPCASKLENIGSTLSTEEIIYKFMIGSYNIVRAKKKYYTFEYDKSKNGYKLKEYNESFIIENPRLKEELEAAHNLFDSDEYGYDSLMSQFNKHIGYNIHNLTSTFTPKKRGE